MRLEAGESVDRYLLISRLGAGGMAEVWLVRHARLGTLHALKVLHSRAAGLRDRLLREGKVQGTLGHPGIVRVTDVIEVDGQLGLVMDYVHGAPLDAALREWSPQLDGIDAVARQVLAAVAAAHAQGVVHRDLKPANILLDLHAAEVAVRVTDFGLAKALATEEQGGTRSGVSMGTPAYMAPEQIRDAGKVDARADVFALGATFYELVAGQRAFRGTDSFDLLSAVTSGRRDPLSSRAPWLEPRLIAVIDRALELEPDARYADASEMLQAWVAALDGRAAPSLPSDALPPPRALPELEAQAKPAGRASGSETWADDAPPHPAPTSSAPVEPGEAAGGTLRPGAPAPATAGRALAAGAVLLGLLLVLGAVEWNTRPRALVVSENAKAQAAYEEFVAASEKGDLRRAREQAMRGAELDPSSPRLALVSVGSDAFTALIAAAEKASALAPPGPEGDFERAFYRAVQQGDSPEAAAALDAWMETRPEDPVGLLLAALYYPAHGTAGSQAHTGTPHDHGPTIKLRAFVERYPTWIPALCGLAIMEREDGHPAEGRRLLDQALATCEACAGPHTMAAEWAVMDRDWDLAEEHTRKALAADPSQSGNRERLADLALYRGDESRRVEQVEVILADQAASESVRAVFAIQHSLLLIEAGRVAEARSLTRRAFAMPQSADPVGVLYTAIPQVDAALALKDAALMEELIGYFRALASAPETPSTTRDAMSAFGLTHEIFLAYLRGDVATIAAIEARIRGLDPGVFSVMSKDDALMGAEITRGVLSGDMAGPLALIQAWQPQCQRSFEEALVFERFGMVEEAERAWGESLASDKRCPTLVHTVVAQVSLAEIALKKGDTQSASRFAAEARSRWPTPDAEQQLAQRLMKVEAALARP